MMESESRSRGEYYLTTMEDKMSSILRRIFHVDTKVHGVCWRHAVMDYSWNIDGMDDDNPLLGAGDTEKSEWPL